MKNKEQIAKIWDVLDSLNVDVLHNKQAIIKLENEREQPQLKQLDQSVFDGQDKKWRFAAVDKSGKVWVYSGKPDRDCDYWFVKELVGMSIGRGYDTSNWQNSLIERDITKELTGSELCRAMLARGDKYVLCHLSQTSEKSAKDVLGIAIGHDHSGFRVQRHNSWQYAIPINNQGEPLTASEVGL